MPHFIMFILAIHLDILGIGPIYKTYETYDQCVEAEIKWHTELVSKNITHTLQCSPKYGIDM